MNQEELTACLNELFPDKIEAVESARVEPIFLLKNKDDLPDFCRIIKDDDRLDFSFLCNISGVDTGENFEIVYQVVSIRLKHRFDFKVVMDYGSAEIDSVQSVWPGANWHEREIWELYGINIKKHGNLKRFLLPDDWDQGNPMKKDWDGPDYVRMPEVE
jgi:NADH-quinone oxidoreductase subunit C